MLGISKEFLLDQLKDCPFEHRVSELERLVMLCKELDPWLPIDEFLKSGFEGSCFIVFNGESNYCYFSEGEFRFYRGSCCTFTKTQITRVMPIHKPEPPRC